MSAHISSEKTACLSMMADGEGDVSAYALSHGTCLRNGIVIRMEI
jgi:hypothetical protein